MAPSEKANRLPAMAETADSLAMVLADKQTDNLITSTTSITMTFLTT